MAGVYYDAGTVRTRFVAEFCPEAAFQDIPAFQSKSLRMQRSQAWDGQRE
jgi:hypothetical protein